VDWDCIVVGGGPAGLSAALTLGRARRRVLVLDAGTPRNHCSASMHGYLTRDGVLPADFLRIAREELQPYAGVTLREAEATDVEAAGQSFRVRLGGDGTAIEWLESRTLLLATGVVDDVPVIEGIDRFYGRTVHHCPYCDGWEHRDAPIAVYGCTETAVRYAIAMLVWSPDVILCTDGFPAFPPDLAGELGAHGIAIYPQKIVRLEGAGDRLARIVLEDGSVLPRTALFFSTAQRQRSGFAAALGCHFTDAGAVATGESEATGVPGLFVAGDASRDAQLVVVAAAEGALAGVAINTLLTRQDLLPSGVTAHAPTS
jgi:thioredoxin reductase